jgi:hypothetical protein
MEKSVLVLNNEFISFFIGINYTTKKFIFKAQSINEEATEEVPILFVEGIIVRCTCC